MPEDPVIKAYREAQCRRCGKKGTIYCDCWIEDMLKPEDPKPAICEKAMYYLELAAIAAEGDARLVEGIRDIMARRKQSERRDI